MGATKVRTRKRVINKNVFQSKNSAILFGVSSVFMNYDEILKIFDTSEHIEISIKQYFKATGNYIRRGMSLIDDEIKNSHTKN